MCKSEDMHVFIRMRVEGIPAIYQFRGLMESFSSP